MIKILTDQNFDGRIIRGLSRRLPELDIVRTEDQGLKHFVDADILTRAADEDRIVLTHDKKTFEKFAYQKIERGDRMCGVVIVPGNLSIGQAIEELLIAIKCHTDAEWANKVLWLPL